MSLTKMKSIIKKEKSDELNKPSKYTIAELQLTGKTNLDIERLKRFLGKSNFIYRLK